MTTIICITNKDVNVGTYNYNYTGDRILENKFNGDYEIYYSGQNQGKLDQQLINSINNSSTFRIYYRRTQKEPFKFLGSTNISDIIQYRTVAINSNAQPNERLQIRLVIPSIDIIDTPVNSPFEGTGKYKKAVLQHSNFNVNRQNLNLGFYVG